MNPRARRLRRQRRKDRRDPFRDPSFEPYVCPGCHAVAAPCAPDCIDLEISKEYSHAYYGDWDAEYEDEGHCDAVP